MNSTNKWRRIAGWLDRAAPAWAAFALAGLAGAASGATITVTGNGDFINPNGAVSLREAITSINNGANVNADVVPVGAYGVNDTINFNIALAGRINIALQSALPTLTKPVTINGYTQPGASPNSNGPTQGSNSVLMIELNCQDVCDPLTIAGGNSTVRGLVINRFAATGIAVTTNGGNTIAGNFIGTDGVGSAVSGIGSQGIVLSSSNNTVGGTQPADRNLVSGATVVGISIFNAQGNLIQNNLIGTNAAGTASLGNATGVQILGNGPNTVGGTSSAARNVISGNGAYGLFLSAQNVSAGAVVQGNYIGTNAAGTAPLPNNYGVATHTGFGSNLIGGTVAGAGNLISGNGLNGVLLASRTSGNTVQGNLIGTNPAGTAAISGHSVAGVEIARLSNGNQVGGTVANAGNVIAFNTGKGVLLSDVTPPGGFNNSILGNRIFGNGSLGIKLGSADNLPTPNDAGDADTGPNGLQNYPILTTTIFSGGNVSVSGTLNSAAASTYRVEFFSNTGCDASGSGEGQSYLGFANVTTNGSGDANFGPVSFAVPPGQLAITATATDSNNNTSEFSRCAAEPGTFTVTNTNDSGAGSLRNAISLSNAAPGSNTIDFAPNVTGTITLTSGQLFISHGPVNIVGPGAGILAIDGGANGRVLAISDSPELACPGPVTTSDFPVTISGLTFRNASTTFFGGGIVSTKSLTLQGVTFQANTAQSGGAVDFSTKHVGQTLFVQNSTFVDNRATLPGADAFGGAILVSPFCDPATSSSVTIDKSLFQGNRVQPGNGHSGTGGAVSVYSNGDVTITDSRIVDNHVDLPAIFNSDAYGGGGLFFRTRAVTIRSSEIANNSSGRGGAIHFTSDDPIYQGAPNATAALISNSTISGNIASLDGGGLVFFGNVAGRIANSTVTGNIGPSGKYGGIRVANQNLLTEPTLAIVSSVIANSAAGTADIGIGAETTNLALPFTVSTTNSLIETPGLSIAITGAGNLTGVDPQLGPLANNGGPTRTHALLAGSPAINSGSNPDSLVNDQRGAGYARVFGIAADMGAYEFNPIAAPALQSRKARRAHGSAGPFDLTLSP